MQLILHHEGYDDESLLKLFSEVSSQLLMLLLSNCISLYSRHSYLASLIDMNVFFPQISFIQVPLAFLRYITENWQNKIEPFSCHWVT